VSSAALAAIGYFRAYLFAEAKAMIVAGCCQACSLPAASSTGGQGISAAAQGAAVPVVQAGIELLW
jgi:hypothetical protein